MIVGTRPSDRRCQAGIYCDLAKGNKYLCCHGCCHRRELYFPPSAPRADGSTPASPLPSRVACVQNYTLGWKSGGFSEPKPRVTSGFGHQSSQMSLSLGVWALLGDPGVVGGAPTQPLSQTRMWRRHSPCVWRRRRFSSAVPVESGSVLGNLLAARASSC